MAVFVWGLVGIIVFFLLILGVGVWAGTKQKNQGQEEMMLAGRSIGLFVGTLTIIATWVGGSYINGTSEVMFTSGLAWCQVPIGYSVSLIFGVMMFVRPMREANYITMLDPFQDKYGARIGSLMFIPALMGDVFWIASVIDALGSSLTVILDVNKTLCVIVSTAFAAAYTMAGGFYSVSYTDAVQLILIVFGLILSVPFAYQSDAVSHDTLAKTDWLGHLETEDIPMWIDSMLLLIFGGIPWQEYFQRILSMKTTRAAENLSIIATFGCMLMAVPPAFVGVIAKATDWSNVEGFNANLTAEQTELILPLVLRYLTPNWVAFFGLGAISAAVMSSADASILSSSSMFSRNLYKMIIRPSASEREVAWVLKISIVVVSTLATVIALTVGSVYYLSVICSDLVYVILFPQLVLVVYWSHGVNRYGCVSSFTVGILLRILGGEKGLGIPAVIKYPRYDAKTSTQKFPFRTLSMLIVLMVHVLVSWAARVLFKGNYLSIERWDVLGEFTDKEHLKGEMVVKHKETNLVGTDNPASNIIVSRM